MYADLGLLELRQDRDKQDALHQHRHHGYLY